MTLRLGRTSAVRRTAAVGVTAAAALFFTAGPALAAGSSSYAARADVTLLGAAAVNTGELAASGLADSPNTLASISVPTVLSTGLATSDASRDANTGALTSGATVNNLALGIGGVLTTGADTISARCSATEAGTTGTTTIENLNASVAGLPVAVNGAAAPNTTVNLGLAGVTIATLTVNEQLTNADGGLTVNSLHLRLLGGVLGSLGTGDVVIASATCGPAELPVPLAHGAGMAAGFGLLGLAAIGFWFFHRRRSAGLTAG